MLWGGNGMCVLAFVLAAALCVRQVFYRDALTADFGSTYIHVSSQVHQISFQVDARDDMWLRSVVFGAPLLPVGAGVWQAGPIQGYYSPENSYSPQHEFELHFADYYIEITIPMWFILLLSFTPPAASWFIARRRRRGTAEHPLCHACGYDLHGRTSKQCPECGEVIAKDEQ